MKIDSHSKQTSIVLVILTVLLFFQQMLLQTSCLLVKININMSVKILFRLQFVPLKTKFLKKTVIVY